MGGTLKGGSSSMWYPATREHYRAFKRWHGVEGVVEGRDDEALEGLAAFLAEHGIELCTQRGGGVTSRRPRDDPAPHPGYGPLYRDVHEILRQLPESHLRRESLRCLRLGGWGPDAAKASAYKEGVVHMYDFACRGARRTFLGLFLHELGHAHEVALDEEIKNALHRDYLEVLVEADAFFGVEFLVDVETRKLYQKFVFNEFLAETYMVYTACGARMRAEIEAMPEEVRRAWRRVYGAFRDSFEGIEYA